MVKARKGLVTSRPEREDDGLYRGQERNIVKCIPSSPLPWTRSTPPLRSRQCLVVVDNSALRERSDSVRSRDVQQEQSAPLLGNRLSPTCEKLLPLAKPLLQVGLDAGLTNAASRVYLYNSSASSSAVGKLRVTDRSVKMKTGECVIFPSGQSCTSSQLSQTYEKGQSAHRPRSPPLTIFFVSLD